MSSQYPGFSQRLKHHDTSAPGARMVTSEFRGVPKARSTLASGVALHRGSTRSTTRRTNESPCSQSVARHRAMAKKALSSSVLWYGASAMTRLTAPFVNPGFHHSKRGLLSTSTACDDSRSCLRLHSSLSAGLSWFSFGSVLP